MKKEAITHGVLEDLANRNDNWDKLDGVINQVNELEESRLILKNEIVNGDFKDLSKYKIYNDSLTVDDGIGRVIKTSGTAATGVTIPLANTINIGDKVYYDFQAKLNSGKVNITLTIGTDSFAVSNHIFQLDTVTPDFIRYTGIYSSIENLNGFAIGRGTGTPDLFDVEVKNIKYINLTQTFGAGNEPTKEEMDLLISQIGYIDGEITLTQTQLLNWNLELTRLKADIQQEAWITPTLLNGWKSMSGREVQYMKDEMGFVHFRGDLDPSTKTSTVAFSVPIGYRPSRHEYINIGDTSYFIGCSVYGSVSVSIGTWGWQSLNYFKYRAD